MIEDLIKRYQTLFPEDEGTPTEILMSIEVSLNIVLPGDFKEISKMFSWGCLGGFSLLSISSDERDPYSIVTQTKALRSNVSLPITYIPIYNEYGLIYLDTCSGTVTYCSTENINDETGAFRPSTIYDTYNSYASFFAYLLDKEEKERSEEEAL